MIPASNPAAFAPENTTPEPGARKVVAYLLSTLDGVMQDPGNWVFDAFDAEMSRHLRQTIAPQDAVILGRKTYESWKETWPSSTREPFASFINGTCKYVASRSLTRLEWAQSRVMRDVTSELAELKAAAGGDIGIHGSVSLVRSLMATGLIDELKIVMMPVLVGSGAKLLDDPKDMTRVTLLGAQVTNKGVLVLTYRLRSAPAVVAAGDA